MTAVKLYMGGYVYVLVCYVALCDAVPILNIGRNKNLLACQTKNTLKEFTNRSMVH